MIPTDSTAPTTQFKGDVPAIKPTVGRDVHFQSYNENGECHYAAKVTQVNEDGTLELATFGPNSLYFQHKVPYSEVPKAGHWNWPPRV
jgi:hypothetical protein